MMVTIEERLEGYKTQVREGDDWLLIARDVAGMAEIPLTDRVALLHSLTEWGAGYELGAAEERIRLRLVLARGMRIKITDGGLPAHYAEVVDEIFDVLCRR